MQVSDGIRLGLAIAMLAVASASDLRTRRVPNHYWSPFVGFTVVFVLHDILAGQRSGQELLWGYGVAAGLCALWYGLWWMHAFGGADAKGLMVLAFLLPWPVDAQVPVPPTLDAVSNGAALVLALPIVFLAANVARGRLRMPVALLGVPMDLDRAQRSKVWPMQRMEGGRMVWRYWQRLGGDLPDVYRELRLAGLQRVWATPKVPFMVPLLAGLVLAAWKGNLLLGLLLRP